MKHLIGRMRKTRQTIFIHQTTEPLSSASSKEEEMVNIKINTEKYYAPYYDEKWLVGSIISKMNENVYEMKFLDNVLDEYY